MRRLMGRRLSSLFAGACSRRFSVLAQPAVAAAEAGVILHKDAKVVPRIPRFDYTPPPYDGPRAEEILRKRSEFLSPSLFHLYRKPEIQTSIEHCNGAMLVSNE